MFGWMAKVVRGPFESWTHTLLDELRRPIQTPRVRYLDS